MATLTPSQLGQNYRLRCKLNASNLRDWRCGNRRRGLCHSRRAYRLLAKLKGRVTFVPLASVTLAAKQGEPSYAESNHIASTGAVTSLP